MRIIWDAKLYSVLLELATLKEMSIPRLVNRLLCSMIDELKHECDCIRKECDKS